MALIKCNECGKDISDQATTCPNCGAKTEIAENIKQNTKQIIKILSFLLLIVISFIIVIYSINANNPIIQYKKEAIEILNNLKSRDISVQQAKSEIGALQKEFENAYIDKIKDTSNNSVTYYCFNLCLSTIETSLYLDSISTGITNVKINEYIEQIKRQ